MATPPQLAVINFELILDYLAAAEAVFDHDAAYHDNIRHARDFFKELVSSLDLRYALARQLLSVYIYVNRLFAVKIVKKDAEALTEAKKLLTILYEGFSKIQDSDDTAHDETRLFAGLTYNYKGEPNEYLDSVNRNAYKA